MNWFKRKLLIILFFFLVFSVVKAQTIPDIIAEYNNASDPDVKISLLVKLGLNYQNLRAYRKALDYYTEALELYQDKTFFTDKVFILKNAGCAQLRIMITAALTWIRDILPTPKILPSTVIKKRKLFAIITVYLKP